MTTANDFFAAKPILTKYTIEGMEDKPVFVKLLTKVDRDKLKNFVKKYTPEKDKEGNFPEDFSEVDLAICANIIFAITNDKGKPLFTEKHYEAGDMATIPEKWQSVLFGAVLECNKIDEKTIAKNS